jgi:hypothetical protein
MILQSGGMAQVLDHVTSKFESLTLNPSMPKEEKEFSVSSLMGSLFLTTFSFSPKSHWNFCNPDVHMIYSANNINFHSLIQNE